MRVGWGRSAGSVCVARPPTPFGYFVCGSVCRFVVCPSCARVRGLVVACAHGTWGLGARGIVGVGPAAHARVGTV